MEACDHVFYRNLRKVYPVADRAEGVYIWDTRGKRYLDGSGGACVVSIGHGVPAILEAMQKQFKRVPFVHSSHFTNPAACELGDRLHAMAPDESAETEWMLEVYDVLFDHVEYEEILYRSRKDGVCKQNAQVDRAHGASPREPHRSGL